jgi:hypothetical protein
MKALLRRLPMLWLLLGMHAAHAALLVATNSTWNLFRGRSAPSTTPGLWREPTFNDAAWPVSRAPFSYGDGVTIGTVLADMQGNYSTVFLRTRFQVADTSKLRGLLLRAACDDGFIAWLNGREVVRANVAPGERPFDAHNAPDHSTTSVAEPLIRYHYPIDAPNLLRNGENVLCVQVFNATLFSSDIFFDAELTAVADESDPPTIVAVVPAPGEATNLTQVQVTFSEPVTGVTSGDLMLNGFPASGITIQSSTTYTFRFTGIPLGNVRATWVTDHGIADAAATPNPFASTAADATWDYTLVDPNAPLLIHRLPAQGTVRQLSSVEVQFSENVTGLDASDLLVNGQPALSVSGAGAGPFVFTFAPVAAGPAEIRFTPEHGIRDLGNQPMAFAGAAWNVTVDPAFPDPTIRINEIVAANATGLTDEEGEPQPWIEIQNYGTEPVRLGQLSLSDDRDQPGEWVFPDVTLGAGRFLVVFASAKDRRSSIPGARLHTNFQLARRGEYLGLFNAESPRRPISELAPKYPNQRNDISWARRTDGTWAYHQTPTPAAANTGTTLRSACEPVVFSVPRGYFSGSFELLLSTPTPGATIRYTLSGAEPNATNSLEYSAPILVNRTLVVRAIATRPGLLPSETATHSYLVNLSVAQRALPALSLATATNNLTGPTGIVGMQGGSRDGSGAWVRVNATDYFNPLNRGSEWERPVSVEYLSPTANGEFQINAGLRLHASDWFRPRLTASSKFSWRLYFRGDYGEGRLRHPFVPVSSVEEFDAIVCRAGSNDLNPFVRDEIARRLFADCGQVSSRGTFVTLFMNGRYSGFYNPVERIESDFLAIHHGAGDAWDVLSQSGPLDGDRASFDTMLTATQTGSPTSSAWYQGMTRRLDVTNFVDYLLVNAYGYTGDWPHNNWRAARERRDGALWRYYIWDAEWSFGLYDRAVSGNTFNELGTTEIGILYSRLRQNPEFRLLFADRVHRHLFNGGVLTEANVVRHFAETTAGLSGLVSGLDRSLTNNWVKARPNHLRSHLVAAGLFASSNAPVLRQFGGHVPAGFVLTMTNQGGTVWYTTNGADPRVAFTGSVNGTALAYASGNPPVLNNSTLIRARSLQGTTWSALTEAAFTVGDPGIPVRIGEIQYQPAGGSAYEFVELRNTSGRPVPISGFSFDGIDFRFPANTTLPAGAVWILASDDNPAAFAVRHPGVAIAGYFGGALNNAGETLTLRDASGGIVDSVRYRPNQGWPSAAAGSGRSLERFRFDLDASDPAAWRSSAESNGSPGVPALPTAPPTSVRIDEVFATNTGQLLRSGNAPDYVELLGVEPGSTDLTGWSLYRTDRTNRFHLPTATRLEQGDRLVLWCGDASPGDLTTGFRLDGQAGVIVLADASGVPRSVFAYGPQANGWSVGFLPDSNIPRLLVPSPGEPNIPAESAPIDQLVLNEWLANPIDGDDDFIELHNRDAIRPVFLHGAMLSVSNSTHTFRFPSVVAPSGFAAFVADESGAPDSLPFRLPAAGANVRLLSPAGRILDQFAYANAAEGVAQGRFPDGSNSVSLLPLGGTPGAPNLLTPRAGPRFSEILAASIAGAPQANLARDWLELVNLATNSIPLAGWRIRLTEPESASWTIPSGLALASGARLRIHADPSTPPSTSSTQLQNTGFALPDDGGTLELVAADGLVRDRRTFGAQIAGQSIGLNSATNWVLLSSPTPGATNAAPAALSTGDLVRINEWLAQGTNSADFIELHNAADQPVDLSDWRLTDDPSLAGLQRFRIPPLTFIGRSSWRVFVADGSPGSGPNHTPFQLAATGETLRLYRPNSNLVDGVTLVPAGPGITSGRFPDGSVSFSVLSLPTPGTANLLLIDSDNDGMPDDWELANGLNPTFSSDGNRDNDDDGRSNLDEFRAGTDPRNAASVLSIQADWDGSTLRLRFTAESGRSYSLQSRADLDAPWIQRMTFQPAATRRVLEIPINSVDPSGLSLFRIATPATP